MKDLLSSVNLVGMYLVNCDAVPPLSNVSSTEHVNYVQHSSLSINKFVVYFIHNILQSMVILYIFFKLLTLLFA